MSRVMIALRIGILISLLILLLTFVYTPKNHCGECKFELDDEKISGSDFMKEYYNVCIDSYVKKNQDTYNVNYMNETFKINP